MRTAGVLLLAAALARADLATEVRRAFRPDDAGHRVIALDGVRLAIGPAADRKERNRAAAELGKRYRREPDPSVRRAVLDVLLALRTGRSLDRLVTGVFDEDESVRAHVHGIVRDHADPMLQKAVVRVLQHDASWRARAAMVELLLSGSRNTSLPPLVDALEDDHPAVAARAAEALERLTGMAFGTDRQRWREYFEEQTKKEAEKHEPGERRTTTKPRKVEVKQGPIRGLVPKLYGIPVEEKRVIFVVDMSSSMHRKARSSHFRELKEALFRLPSDVHFNVLCFDQRLFFFTKAKSLVPATIDSKAKVERWINDLPAGRKTDIVRSLVTGIAMLREALESDEKADAELFILTDGKETKTTMSLRVLRNHYARLPSGRCRVHVVALGRGDTPTLKALAVNSGGMFVEAPAKR